MKLSTQPYKGTRDFYPEDMRLRNWMFARMRKVCESYGYEEYDVPVLEPLELYTSKTSEEVIGKQSYSFVDRGGRKIIMRPEITPSVSRMVAGRRQELGYPLRLYSIPNCFRYERPQKGRLREFWQLNADIFGVEGIEADVEMIMLADSIMKEFGAKAEMYEIRVNSRVEMNSIFGKLNLEDGQKTTFMNLIDKKEKIEPEEFNKLFDQQLGKGMAARLLEALREAKAPDNIKGLIKSLNDSGVSNVVYDPGLARGFDYYTDIVFEVFDKNPDNNRSMFGGGRYDNLLGNFGVEPVPSVGFGMGDATLENFLSSNGLIPKLRPAADAAILLIGDAGEKIQPIAGKLRKLGVNVSIDYEDRKIDKKIKSALKRGERYALFVGPDEIEKDIFTLKDLDSSKETKDTLENIAKIVKKSDG
jgi:histidyl-tRNA synthetase